MTFHVRELSTSNPAALKTFITLERKLIGASPLDLPPKAVPPRVLVQAPPFGWGVVQEAEVG